jgi:AI-2 transport protein TqsA
MRDGNYFNLSGGMRWGVNALLLLAVVLALYWGQRLFIPTVIALLLTAMLWPAAERIHRGIPFPLLGRLTVPWSLSVVVLVTGLVLLTLAVPLSLGLAVPKVIQDFPTDPAKQEELYARVRGKIAAASPVPLDEEYLPAEANRSRVFESIKTALDPKSPTNVIVPVLGNVAGYGSAWVWEWVLIMFLLLFMLLEGPMLSRRLVAVFGPSPEAQAKAIEALSDMAAYVRTYLVWRTLVSIGLAVVLGLVYKYGFGLRLPWTWAILTAVLVFIPYLGAIAAGVFPVLDAFITLPNPLAALGVLAVYVVVITLEGYVVVPVVMGRPMQLNATTVLLACLFWELVWGTPGLFLAMPLMAAIKAICTHVPGWQAWANLMSTHPEPVPAKLDAVALADDLTEKG